MYGHFSFEAEEILLTTHIVLGGEKPGVMGKIPEPGTAVGFRCEAVRFGDGLWAAFLNPLPLPSWAFFFFFCLEFR